MAHITVPEDSNNGRSETVVGSTPQDEFPFTYPYFSDDDIKVYVDGEVETGFTVTGTGSAVDGGYSSGKVTLDTPVSDVTVVTEREIALSREEDFPYPSSTLNIKALNTALDRFIAIFQQFRRKLTRTLRQPVGDVDELNDLPPAATRAGQVFVWDEDGQPSVGGSAFPGTITADYIPVGNAAGDAYDLLSPTALRTLIAAQPLDSDLTAIAALTTTAFGRALLELADAAALRTAAGLGTAATQNTGAFDAAGSAAAAQAASQPLDSDLTAIAALTTTAYGRAFLALADAAALRTAGGLGTISTQAASSVAITGGAIDNTPIGGTTPAAGSFTGVTVTGSSIPANGVYLPSANTLGISTNSTLRGVVDSSGNLVVGNASAVNSSGGNTPQIQAHATIGQASFRWNAGVGGANFILAHSRNATVGTHSALVADDGIGTVNFQASDGTNFLNNSAHIAAFVDGAVSSGITPARLSFFTQDLAGNPTERLKLNSAGGAILQVGQSTPAGGLAGVGLMFGSTTNFGIFFGSGAPSLSAAKGSLYLRSDGSGTTDRMYVNTNGTTGWTAVTTAS